MSAAAQNEPFSKVEVCNASMQQPIQDKSRHIIWKKYSERFFFFLPPNLLLYQSMTQIETVKAN